jgi:uncharacterized protein YukE
MADAPTPAAPSWDQIVDRVCVASNYLCLERAARHWQNVFGLPQADGEPEQPAGQLGQLRRALQKLLIQSGTNWHGAGAGAFQQHVKGLIGAVEGIQREYQGLQKAAADSATHLKTAVENIHVPLNRYEEVVGAQEAFQAGVPWYIRPFKLDLALYQAYPETYNAFQRFLSGGEYNAQLVYNQLVSNYSTDRKSIPAGVDVPVPGVGSIAGADGSNGPGGTAGPGAGRGLDAKSGLDGLGSGLSPGGLQTPASTAGLTAPTAPSSTPLPDLSTTEPPALPGTADPVGVGDLPGIGDPDTSGLAGVGGLGGGVGGGGGVPGLGAVPGSASGFGAPGPAARGLGVAGVGGVGGTAGVGGTGMYPPMMPMGGGHGGTGSQGSNTDNFLREDEVKAMFGFDNDVPGGGVLDA